MPNPLHDPRYAVLRQVLVALRERRSLTRMEVAQRLGKPRSWVSKYERGERRLDILGFIDIAKALDVDASARVRALLRKLAQ